MTIFRETFLMIPLYSLDHRDLDTWSRTQRSVPEDLGNAGGTIGMVPLLIQEELEIPGKL